MAVRSLAQMAVVVQAFEQPVGSTAVVVMYAKAVAVVAVLAGIAVAVVAEVKT